MLYKGLKGAASIPTNDLVPPIRRTRNHHSLAFQIPMAGTDIYKSSFFPQTIRDWNLLTDSLISASECAVLLTNYSPTLTPEQAKKPL